MSSDQYAIPHGLTKREYFAAAALQSGLVSSYSRLPEDQGNAAIARDCFSIADAMIAESKIK